jgi:hypothetical protein
VLRKSYVLAICMISILFTSGCFKIEAPSETMKIPAYSDADKVFNEYKLKLRENKPPKELLKFLKNNIYKLHENAADIAVVRVIELQKKSLVKYEKKLLEDSDFVKQLKGIETKEIHDITDKKVQKQVNDIIENGFILSSNEVTIDYSIISKIADDNVSDELKEYIKIESTESKKKYSVKESLDSYLEKKPRYIQDFILDLAATLNQTFNYTYKHKNSPYIVRVRQLQSDYLQVFLFGSPNNSTFTYYQGSGIQNNKILKEWDKAYLVVKSTYTTKPYGFGIFMQNYYNELSKNNGILSKELYDYINKKINNQEI